MKIQNINYIYNKNKIQNINFVGRKDVLKPNVSASFLKMQIANEAKKIEKQSAKNKKLPNVSIREFLC